MGISPSGSLDPESSDGLFTPHELTILKSVSRSKIWRLLRDALCLEREKLFSRQPSFDNDREIWLREGELRAVNRLLQQGPHLAVYYDRYVRSQDARGETAMTADISRPGTPPDLEDL